MLRPGVVWFSEMLLEHEWRADLAAAEECGVLLSIGKPRGLLQHHLLPGRSMAIVNIGRITRTA